MLLNELRRRQTKAPEMSSQLIGGQNTHAVNGNNDDSVVKTDHMSASTGIADLKQIELMMQHANPNESHDQEVRLVPEGGELSHWSITESIQPATTFSGLLSVGDSESGRRDSNSRPNAWEAFALPLSYTRTRSSTKYTLPNDQRTTDGKVSRNIPPPNITTCHLSALILSTHSIPCEQIGCQVAYEFRSRCDARPPVR